jgi:ribosomal protein S18 acetylase RimI-like enzyme
MQNLIIRRATSEDVSAIVHLLADDDLGQHRERYENPLPQSYYTAFNEITQDPNNELVVVCLDDPSNEVIGTLQLTFIRYLSHQGGKRAQLESVHVATAHRSQGVGNKLLEWAIARARAENCLMLQLTSTKSRTDAQRFYKRLGFVASHEGMKLDLMKNPAINL